MSRAAAKTCRASSHNGDAMSINVRPTVTTRRPPRNAREAAESPLRRAFMRESEWERAAGSEQLQAAEHFADDLKLAERGFFTRMIRVVGNDFHPRRPRRAQHLQALDDNAVEGVADRVKPVGRRRLVAGVDNDALAGDDGRRHAVPGGVENEQP